MEERPVGDPISIPRRPSDRTDELAAVAAAAGIERVHFVAWRDLDDPEAGGSEIHAHEIASRWARAGLDVTVRTSAIAGRGSLAFRDGYRVERRSGRYGVFPSSAWSGLRTKRRDGDALVEIWNGMPFLSPLWFSGPRITFLHHVHEEMWQMVLPGVLGHLGDLVERRMAPRLYRRTRIVTLSRSSKEEIVSRLGLRDELIDVVPPGIDERFSPGGHRSPVPLVVAVGRLVPVKRFDRLITSLAQAKLRCPDLRAVIVGEGYERPALERLRHELGADEWLDLPGFVDDAGLISWYREAWVVASSSLREGWGMTLTEAAACGTPAVATNIAGHRDAVLNGRSGILVDDVDDVVDPIVSVLNDRQLRTTLSRGALERARWFTWDATAQSTLEILAAEAVRVQS